MQQAVPHRLTNELENIPQAGPSHTYVVSIADAEYRPFSAAFQLFRLKVGIRMFVAR